MLAPLPVAVMKRYPCSFAAFQAGKDKLVTDRKINVTGDFQGVFLVILL